MYNCPRYISVVAFVLGCVDVVRGASHTLLANHAATNIAGLDLSGPSGRDQLVLMAAFGASNLLSAAALIYLALRDRFGALIFLAVIPAAYLVAHTGFALNATDLVGQGVFPGRYMMVGYLSVCLVTVFRALLQRSRSRRRKRAAEGTIEIAVPRLRDLRGESD